MTLSTIFFIAAMISMVAVLITLFAGLFAMTQGDEIKDRLKSNKFMRLRVYLQGLTLLLLLLAWAAR